MRSSAVRLAQILAIGGAAYLITAGVRRAADQLPPTIQRAWERTNHEGRRITLIEGPAWAGGASLSVAAGMLRAAEPYAERYRAWGALAALGAASVAGAADDFAPPDDPKGLRGHLGALRRGRVTTGTIKIIALGAAGVLSAVGDECARAAHQRRCEAGQGAVATSGGRRAVCVLAGAGVVAGAANLANLLDLRPGRALKAAVAVSLPLAVTPGPGAPISAVAIGSAAAVLPEDLRGDAMLGDTGANPLGALVGTAVIAAAAGTRTRLAILAGLAGLTVASERVSFTEVITRTPILRDLDQWGRGDHRG